MLFRSCGLEAEVDGGDIEVRPVDQEQEELVQPQDTAQNESPSGVGGEGPQGHLPVVTISAVFLTNGLISKSFLSPIKSLSSSIWLFFTNIGIILIPAIFVPFFTTELPCIEASIRSSSILIL